MNATALTRAFGRALVGLLGAGLAVVVWPAGAPARERCAALAQCIASVPSGASYVSTRPGGPIDATLRYGPSGSVSLVSLDGRRRWTAATTAGQPLLLSAAGDLDRDGAQDFIFWVLNQLQPAQVCGSTAMRTSSLLVVNGRTGATTTPFPSLADICWDTPTFNYPTQQYDFGSVYVGKFRPAGRGPEVVLSPYYAMEGTVWRLAPSGAWDRVRVGSRATFPFPSTPAFDATYDATNATPCRHPVAGGPCYVTNSHVANGVFLPGTAGGFFVLTSSRAVVYRRDLTPTSDTTWFPGGTPVNGGRNYGRVETYRRGRRTYVDLIGGCSVIDMLHAKLTGSTTTGGDDACGIVRHVERFALSPRGRIVARAGRYYGYSPMTGDLEGRVEYLARARAALGGPGTSWTAYNLLRGGRWSAQILRGPMTTRAHALPGWFVWDTVRIPGRGAALLATRAVSPGNVVPWGFDVLRWNGSRFRSVRHVRRVVPMLVSMPSEPRLHTLEPGLSSAFTRTIGGRQSLLVVDERGARQFVRLTA
jgi:hypothetical protein